MSDRNQLAEQLAQAQSSQSTASGVSPTGAPGAAPGAPPGGVALQLVKVLQQQVQNLEGRLAAGEKQRKALKKVLHVIEHIICYLCPALNIALLSV